MIQKNNKIETNQLIGSFSFIILLLFAVWILIPLTFAPLVSGDFYFNYKNYKKIEMQIDTLETIDASKGSIAFRGKVKKRVNFYVTRYKVWFRDNPNFYNYMDSIFHANNHKLLVFFKDYESPAYFVEDDFQEMSFKTIWVPALIKLGIFILILLNFLFWRRQYHQAILATGMTVKEYEAIEKAKRPKRKSLQEEYEELMKKENEKNKDK